GGGTTTSGAGRPSASVRPQTNALCEPNVSLKGRLVGGQCRCELTRIADDVLVRVPLGWVLIPRSRRFVRMCTQSSSSVTASPLAEPQAEQRPLERTLHGLRLIDEYAWLKAENWREVMRDPFQLDPAIRAYLQAENDYCERALADTKSLRETVFAEMKGRIKEDDSSAPDPDGPYAY